ncbi:MAG: class I SAM-dependent methyltransferase [Anaerolineales bacterium]|nr:class I SAM-dependent methyltransferase [Anaerolineales bacterium]
MLPDRKWGIIKPMELANRLRKRQKHLRKWAQRQGVTCYRLYERDIPEFPLIVDWYDGEVVVWIYGRSKDETAVDHTIWCNLALADIQAGLDVQPNQIFVKERFRQQGLTNQYERVNQTGHVRIVPEQGLYFEVNLSDYLDTGLFLDHRNTRDLVRRQAAGKHVLNLFAYTGSFTCYAIDGGATHTTTVDISRTYCDWTVRNLSHNGQAVGTQHRIIQQDCLQFLREAVQRHEQYDIIICDPPTFSNSKRMNVASFAVARDYPALLRDCAKLLTPRGMIYFSNNARRFKLEQSTLSPALTIRELTPHTIPEDFRNKRIHRCWQITD